MSWYKEGSVNIVQDSKIVTGINTKWTNPLIGVCAGQMLILKTANTIEIYEIASVQSDTRLTLANQYSGATKTGVSYEIPTAPNVSIENLALRVSEMLNYYQLQMEGWQSILTGTGDITLTAPDGRIVTIKSQKALTDAVNTSVKVGSEFPYRGYLGTTNIGNLGGQSYGVYFQNQNSDALPERGYPVSLAGSLVVYPTNAVGPQGCVQTYTTYTGSRQFIRNYIGDAKSGHWEPWIEQITTNNATVDSNGFYKKSSPILRLFANDNIVKVDGFKKAGCALVNDLVAGVTAKRINVGHYEIHGSKGFSKEGWYIQLPEDANGNKKFFAEYSVNKKNVITVKTYTKKWNAELCEIVAGEPVDIADGRWIDVRLDMPVVEEETTEIIEEEEPSLGEQEVVEQTTTNENS